MNALLKQLRVTARPTLDDLSAALGGAVPLLQALRGVPQDSAWHAEGDVEAHAYLTLLEALDIADEHALTGDERLTFLLAAALHDVGKPLTTTRQRGEDGRVRVVAPGHAREGRSYLAYRLPELGLPASVTHAVLGLVGHHHDVFGAAEDDTERAYRRLGRVANVRLLAWLDAANQRGRVAGDLRGRLQVTELFELGARAAGVWGSADPYEDWAAVIGRELADFSSEFREFVLARGVMDHEAGVISTPHEAVARSYPARNGFPQVVVTCGPDADARHAWIREHLRDHDVVSLEALARELTVKKSVPPLGRVLQEAKERLRVSLRAKRKVVWDAPNLRENFRSLPLRLGREYGSLTTLVVFQPPLSEVFAPRAGGENDVPAHVLAERIASAEFPEPTEAHRTVVVDEYGRTALRFGFAFGGSD